MESSQFTKYLLCHTKGKVCMYDTLSQCSKSDCKKSKLKNVHERQFIKTIANNAFDSSVTRNIPFYLDDEKFINNKEEMDEYIKSKKITDKADIRFYTSDKIKKDILKHANNLAKLQKNKTQLGVCSKHLFMPCCNNYNSGNVVTIKVRYPDNSVTNIDLCYSDRHHSFNFCNCDIELTKSKKTGRYYIKDLFKIKNSDKIGSKINLGDFVNDSSEKTSFDREDRIKKVDKNFKMEEKSFPSMNNEKIQKLEPKKWVSASSPVSQISIESIDRLKVFGPQREISSSSLSEMGSPIRAEIKPFDSLVKDDLTKLKARSDFIRIINSIKDEYNKTTDLAIKYYEKYQSVVVTRDSTEMTYKNTISDLKKKLEQQHREQMLYLEEYSDMSEFSDTNSEISNDSNNSLILDDF